MFLERGGAFVAIHGQVHVHSRISKDFGLAVHGIGGAHVEL